MRSPTSLAVRRIAPGNVEEMRSRLATALQLEKVNDSLRYPKYPFSFEEDQNKVGNKLKEISALLKKFDGDKRSNEGQKLQSKLAHILGRLDNMEATEGDQPTKKAELLAHALSLWGKFNPAAEIAEGEYEPGQPAEGADFSGNLAQAPASSPVRSQNGVGSPPTAPSAIKPVPPSKWNLKFSGNLREMSLNAFLELVEDYRVAAWLRRTLF